MQESIFDKLDFGPLKPLLDNDDITDISYCNGGQIWIRSLTQGSLRVEIPSCTQEFMEKLAFQCSNVMGTTFNNAKPFLDAESSELRLNFVHDSIATNGVACVIRKTPAKIRLEKDKLLKDDYFTADIHDVLIKCVEGHCNIIVSGETGSGKTEFVKYLASHTKENEKIITIEDTLELHLDKIFPHRDIVAMKTNNVASYTDVLVTCMRQNPKWILLSEVRSAEAVTAVRNSISSGHNILSTIHADKASAIPYRLYSLMETDLDVDQFLTTIYRYIQLGVHIKAYYSKEYGKFHREVDEVVEFYVDDDNVPRSHTIYRKIYGQEPIMTKPSAHLLEYLENQNIDISNIVSHLSEGDPLNSDETEPSSGEDNNNSSIPVQNEGGNEINTELSQSVDNQDINNTTNNEEDVSNVFPTQESDSQVVSTKEVQLPDNNVVSVQNEEVNQATNNMVNKEEIPSTIAPNMIQNTEGNVAPIQNVEGQVENNIASTGALIPQVAIDTTVPGMESNLVTTNVDMSQANTIPSNLVDSSVVTNTLVNTPVSSDITSRGVGVNDNDGTAAVISNTGGNMANPIMENIPVTPLNNNAIPDINNVNYEVQGAITPTIDENMINNNIFASNINFAGENIPVNNNQMNIGNVPDITANNVIDNTPISENITYTADVGQPVLPMIDASSANNVPNMNENNLVTDSQNQS